MNVSLAVANYGDESALRKPLIVIKDDISVSEAQSYEIKLI